MRIGPSHQAGSDSLLTAATFFKMRELYFNDRIDDAEYNGKLYGLGHTVTTAFSESNSTSAINLRSGATMAERGSDRTQMAPVRDGVIQGQANSQPPNLGVSMQNPGMGSFQSPYSLPNGGYLRQINVGGVDR